MSKKINKITAKGFIGYPKNIGDKSTASLSIGFNVAKKGEDAVWKNAFIRIEADVNKIDFTKMDGDFVGVVGYLSGDAYTPKDATKEVTKVKIVVGSTEKLEKGNDFKGSVEFETRVSYLETFGEKGLAGSASISFKDNDEYKYANIRFVGNQDLDLNDGDIVVLRGFITGDAYTPKDATKEITKVKFYIQSKEAVVRDNTDDDNAPDTDGHVPASESNANKTKPENVPEVDIDEDEIPF